MFHTVSDDGSDELEAMDVQESAHYKGQYDRPFLYADNRNILEIMEAMDKERDYADIAIALDAMDDEEYAQYLHDRDYLEPCDVSFTFQQLWPEFVDVTGFNDALNELAAMDYPEDPNIIETCTGISVHKHIMVMGIWPKGPKRQQSRARACARRDTRKRYSYAFARRTKCEIYN